MTLSSARTPTPVRALSEVLPRVKRGCNGLRLRRANAKVANGAELTYRCAHRFAWLGHHGINSAGAVRGARGSRCLRPVTQTSATITTSCWGGRPFPAAKIVHDTLPKNVPA